VPPELFERCFAAIEFEVGLHWQPIWREELMADTVPNNAAGKPAVPAAPPAAPAAPAVVTAPAEPAGPPKVKVRKPKQRSCDEKNGKGKLCAGHLKRWYTYPTSIESLIGSGSEIYRCEFCQTLYRPDPGQLPNSFTVRY
jgi:hypothetical protein